MTDRRNTYYQNFSKNLRKIVKCGICGHRQHIEFHHLKDSGYGVGRGRNRRMAEIIKYPERFIPLCHFCHKKVTSFEISIIWNSPSEYLGWIYTAFEELNIETEADIIPIKVI